MYEENNFYEASGPEVSSKSHSFSISLSMVKVFLWMFVGVLVTAGTAYLASHSTTLFAITFNPIYLVFSCIFQIVICFAITKNALVKMKATNATIWFLLYSALTGITFGYLFLMLDSSELWGIFALTAGLFLIMAIAGTVLKEKFLKLSTFIFVGLIALLLLSIVSIFIYSNTLYLGISILGLIVFLILTGVDIARIKTMFETQNNINGVAIYGAFMLYLDFINIYLYLIRIFLASKNN